MTWSKLFLYRKRLCRHSSNLKLWMGPTSTSANAAKRNVTHGRWLWRKRGDASHDQRRPRSDLLSFFILTGSEISALSLPADAPAEAFWFWLHHYAPHQAQRPHDFPRRARHESIHWCGRWGGRRWTMDSSLCQIYIRLILRQIFVAFVCFDNLQMSL